MLGTGASPNEREPRRGAWLIVNLVFVLIVGTCVVRRLPADPGAPGNRYPDAWDAKIAPFAEIVEDERGLEFDHPIYVDFLSVKEFQKQVTSDEEDLTAEDRKEIEQSTGMMRAVGLLEGKVDLFESSNKLAKVGTLGYYSYEDERIRIRGEKLTPAVQSTLVHELTHALQDQHFDLGARFKALEDDEGAASSSFRAVVEGDARRIESEWVEEPRQEASGGTRALRGGPGQEVQVPVLRHPGDPADVHGSAVRLRRGDARARRRGGRGRGREPALRQAPDHRRAPAQPLDPGRP